LAGETEVLGETCPSVAPVHHISHMTRPGFGKPTTNSLSYGASMKLPVSPQLLNLGELVGLFGQVISPSQDLYLHRTTHTHKHPCLE
jgi:hypothetical protein